MHVGIDLGGTKTEIIVLDDAGAERSRRRVPSPQGDYEATLATVAALIAEAEAICGPATSLGIGTPGSIVPETGRMQGCNSVWLNDRALPADLERRLRRPIAVANDADCFALSEAIDGAGAGARSVFGVILGTGVGGGLVVDGRTLAGPNGLTGEWGHNPLPPLDRAPDAIRRAHAALGSRRCWCGAPDCVESWLSGPALARTGRELGGPDRDARELAAAVDSGDALALRTVELYAWQLAAGLGGVVNVLDPACIVLGGGVSNVPRLCNLVAERWGAFVFSAPVRTPLRPAHHGDSGGVRGAAWLGAGAVPVRR